MHDAPEMEAALRDGGAPVTRLSILASLGGSVVTTWGSDDAVLVSGSVDDDRARQVRRSCDMVIANADGGLSPHEVGDPFHPGSFLRVETGFRIAGNDVLLPLFTGTVASYTTSMAGRLGVHCEDPLGLLRQPFGEIVAIGAGTPAAKAVRILCAPVLDPAGGGASWPLDDDGRSTPLRVFLEDEERLDGVAQLVGALGLELFADRLGRPTLRPAPDPTTSDVTVVRGFTPATDDATLLDLERRGDRLPYNRVIVESLPADGSAVVRAVVEVTDPASPVHASRIGVQTAPILRSAAIPDQAAANAVALALLVEHSLSSDAVSGRAIPDPRLDAGDVVRFDEPVSGTADRYRSERITHPVLAGEMSIEATKVLPLRWLA
jgi:hypothetical protein